MEFYRKIIQNELAQRTTKNPNYSQRAFAKSLSVDPGTLSRLLKGERMPGKKLTEKLLNNLDLSPEAQKKFLMSIQQKFSGVSVEDDLSSFNQQQINEEIFRVISDWYFYAILELTYVKDFEARPRWIAQSLQISEALAKDSMDKLLSLGLLEKKSGKIIKSNKNITTQNKFISSTAHRRRQKQILEKAARAVEEIPINFRSQTGMTMAINSKKIPAAKEMILEFNKKLSAFLEDRHADSVYELSISLFPLQKINNRR